MPSKPDARPVILHVTESMGAGVSSALFDYVTNTPEYQHHLLYVERAETKTLPEQWQNLFSTATELPANQFRRILAVRAATRRLKPRVIHSHSSFAGLYARLAVRNSAKLHQVYTPHCYAFERLDLSATARAAYRGAEWLLAFNTGTVVACSPREAQLSKALGGKRANRAAVVYAPNAVSISRVQSPGDKVAARTEVLKLAGSGRLGAQKDPRFFLAAVDALRHNGYGVQARWLGGGDPELTRELTEAGVWVTGWLPRTQLLAELAETDVYFHTAAWEGFPLAVLEASALQTATVVRNIPAFDGVELPLRVSSAEELVALWPQLQDPFARAGAAERSREALRSNTPAAQRTALLAVYGRADPTSTTPSPSASVSARTAKPALDQITPN